MSENTSNGNTLTYKWLVGILVVILMSISIGWVSNVQGAVTKIPVLEEKISRITTIENKVDRLLVERGINPDAIK